MDLDALRKRASRVPTVLLGHRELMALQARQERMVPKVQRDRADPRARPTRERRSLTR